MRLFRHNIFRNARAALAAAVLVCCFALTQAAEPAPQPFAKGDTVCFIGDSITHGGKYQGFVQLFYATRFPDRAIKIYNCGVSGDSAGGACRRLEWDILIHKPTVATLLLGMNDVGRGNYGKNKTDEKSVKTRQAAIEAHVRNMSELAEKLNAAGVKMIFLTPTIYEQNAETGTENFFGVNDGLAVCGKEAGKIAAKFHSPVVDLHAAMDAINAQAQKADPKFTLVGKDRVHPGDVGHLVMAYTLLKAQGMPQFVAKMAIDAAGNRIVAQNNCRIANLTATGEGVSFDCLEHALPFPVPKPAADALRLVPFQKELNQEVLQVGGLAPGNYEVRIDDQVVGKYAAGDLQAGVDLAMNPQTPQYRQAEQVSELNAKRQALESRLRTLALIRLVVIGTHKVDPNDLATVRKLLDERLTKLKNTPYFAYYKSMGENYVKYKPAEKETIAEMERAMASMYEVNQPKQRRFVIARRS